MCPLHEKEQSCFCAYTNKMDRFKTFSKRFTDYPLLQQKDLSLLDKPAGNGMYNLNICGHPRCLS